MENFFISVFCKAQSFNFVKNELFQKKNIFFQNIQFSLIISFSDIMFFISMLIKACYIHNNKNVFDCLNILRIKSLYRKILCLNKYQHNSKRLQKQETDTLESLNYLS